MPPQPGQRGAEAPQEVMALLVEGRRGELRHAHVARVELGHQALDRAALARRVPALEQHAHRRARGVRRRSARRASSRSCSRRCCAAASRSASSERDSFSERSSSSRRPMRASSHRAVPASMHAGLRRLKLGRRAVRNQSDMSVVRTNAAAVMLGVSPNTLRGWERRHGFPTPRRTPGGHRQYDLAEVEALREAFEETHNVSSAISIARDRGAGPATLARLRGRVPALRRGEGRPPARGEPRGALGRAHGRGAAAARGREPRPRPAPPPPEYHFAWRRATGWLAAAARLAAPATRREGVLIIDASSAYDLDGLHVQALELVLAARRAADADARRGRRRLAPGPRAARRSSRRRWS